MNSMIRVALIGIGLVFASAGVARAETLEVKVPFAFTVGTQTLPAGVYHIERDFDLPSSVVLIRGEHGRGARLFVQTTPLKGANPAAEAPALVFAPGETQNRLVEIWESGTVGHGIAPPRGGVRLLGRIILAGEHRP